MSTDVTNDLLTPGVVGIWEPAGDHLRDGERRPRRAGPAELPPGAASGEGGVERAASGAGLGRAVRRRRARPQPVPARGAVVDVARGLRQPGWRGPARWPGLGLPLRVEAASFRGRPVYFQLIGPWTHPYRMQPDTRTAGQKAGGAVGIAVGLLAIGAAVLVARRNYVSGRADRRGSLRLATVVLGLHLALWLCRGHHFLGLEEVGLLLLAIGNSLAMAALCWLLYVALEPYVRKHWPQAIISWSRLLAGRVRDPLVGRDLLFGVLLGLLWALLLHVFVLLIQGQGRLAAARLLGLPPRRAPRRRHGDRLPARVHPRHALLLPRGVPAAGPAAPHLAGRDRVRAALLAPADPRQPVRCRSRRRRSSPSTRSPSWRWRASAS